MPDLDLDAIEARAKVASAGRLNWQGIDALRSLVESDVPALVALVRAKQSWIDGAKVDMAAMEEERAKALAAIARVRALCAGADDSEYTTVFAAAVLAALDRRWYRATAERGE